MSTQFFAKRHIPIFLVLGMAIAMIVGCNKLPIEQEENMGVTERVTLDRGDRGLKVRSIAFSPDGKLLAEGTSGDGPITLWEVATEQQKSTLEGHSAHVEELTFSRDGKFLASASLDTTAKVWDVSGDRLVANLSHGKQWVDVVAFTKDGKHLVTGTSSPEGWLRLWDLQTQQAEVIFKTKSSKLLPADAFPDVRALALSPDGKMLAVVVDAGLLFLEVSSWREKKFIPGVFLNIAYSPDGKMLATGGHDGVEFYDCASYEKKTTYTHASPRAVSSLAFSPQGKTLAVAWGTGLKEPGWLSLWDIAGSRELVSFVCHAHTGAILKIAVSPDGKTLATAGVDGMVKLWNMPPK